MSVIRSEHRTLPVLITLGVLLGAGLALASPVQHRPDRRAGTPSSQPPATMRPSPSASASPTSAAGAVQAPGPGCGHGDALAGWAVGHGSFAHAVRVVPFGCGGVSPPESRAGDGLGNRQDGPATQGDGGAGTVHEVGGEGPGHGNEGSGSQGDQTGSDQSGGDQSGGDQGEDVQGDGSGGDHGGGKSAGPASGSKEEAVEPPAGGKGGGKGPIAGV